MKKTILASMTAIIVVASMIIGAAAAGLTGNWFSLSAGHGTFGVNHASTDNLLRIDGSYVNDEQQEFPFVDVQSLSLGECGIWSDAYGARVSRTAMYTVAINKGDVDNIPLMFRLKLEGPEAEKAAEALVVGVEITGTTDNAGDFIIFSDGDGPWYQESDGLMVASDYYFGTISQNTTGTLSFAFMSTATENIDGDYSITVEIYYPKS
ncbi:hypothetical protein IKF26_00655 [Candidatus Saccharibacteria bacterium]|nr:hypothetical protein [Candidatus Saccharibacteria bacterium]